MEQTDKPTCLTCFVALSVSVSVCLLSPSLSASLRVGINSFSASIPLEELGEGGVLLVIMH